MWLFLYSRTWSRGETWYCPSSPWCAAPVISPGLTLTLSLQTMLRVRDAEHLRISFIPPHPVCFDERGLFAPRRSWRLVWWRRGTSSSSRRRRRRQHRHGNRSCPMEAQRLSVGLSVAAVCCISRLKEVSSVGPEAGWSVNYTAWCSDLSPSSLFVRLSAVTQALPYQSLHLASTCLSLCFSLLMWCST